jgi:hypothetical protein
MGLRKDGVRVSARAPLHPWNGRYVCHDCDEPFAFIREQDGQAGLEDAYLQVAHVHDDEHPDGIWMASVFRRRKGGRYPQDVKALQLIVQEQKKR